MTKSKFRTEYESLSPEQREAVTQDVLEVNRQSANSAAFGRISQMNDYEFQNFSDTLCNDTRRQREATALKVSQQIDSVLNAPKGGTAEALAKIMDERAALDAVLKEGEGADDDAA